MITFSHHNLLIIIVINLDINLQNKNLLIIKIVTVMNRKIIIGY